MYESNRDRQTEWSSSHRHPSPPMTVTGVAKYGGVLSEGDTLNVLVSGNIPKGETTRNITYFVVDKNTKAILSETVLPEVSDRLDAVRVLLRVQRVSGDYDIGTFASSGEFRPAGFLCVRALNSSSAGPTGRIT